MKRQLSAVLAAFFVVSANAQTIDLQKIKDYFPQIHGTVRGKYEYQTTDATQRFQVRNARISIDGKVVPDMVSYKAEIDLSDEGVIKMLDVYARVTPWKGIDVTVGQMRVPFTIDAHRSPHLQYFANRSFIAKQMGSLRDAGATVKYSHTAGLPFSVEAGLFNGSGLTQQKGWHKTLSYSAKLIMNPFDGHNITLSTQRIRPANNNVYMYDLGTFLDYGNWHFEAEAMYKRFAHTDFDNVWAVDAFVNYDFWPKKRKRMLKKISLLARFDYMGDNNDGKTDTDGVLYVTDHERHRLTGGLTFSFGKPFQADLRLNYEKYFYHEPSNAKESEQDKLVVEMMVRF